MIGRRLGRAIWLSQGQASSSYTKARVSLPTPHDPSQTSPSYSRGFVSSSLQQSAFIPTQSRAAKKKTIKSVEESIEEDMEEEDLFAISDAKKENKKVESSRRKSQIPLTRANGNAATKIPFEQGRQSLLAKLQSLEDDRSNSQSLRKSDWTKLMQSVQSKEELESCLELSKKWKNLTYNAKSRLPPFDEKAAKQFLETCMRLNCPEIAFDAMMNRRESGLELDLELVRIMQANILRKLARLDYDPDKGTAQIANEADTASIIVDSNSSKDATVGEKEKLDNSTSLSINLKLLQDKLSLVDRTVALVTFTSVFSTTQSTVDVITLLLSIQGMINSFRLCYVTDKNKVGKQVDEFVKLQIHPRVFQALTILTNDKMICSSRTNMVHKDLKITRSRSTITRSCSAIARYLRANSHLVEEEMRVPSRDILKHLFRIMSQFVPERVEEFKGYCKRLFPKVDLEGTVE